MKSFELGQLFETLGFDREDEPVLDKMAEDLVVSIRGDDKYYINSQYLESFRILRALQLVASTDHRSLFNQKAEVCEGHPLGISNFQISFFEQFDPARACKALRDEAHNGSDQETNKNLLALANRISERFDLPRVVIDNTSQSDTDGPSADGLS